MRVLLSMILMLLAFPMPSQNAAAAKQGNPTTGWEESCRRVKDVSFPAEDRPDAAAVKELGTCSSEGLYYGFGQTADPVKARQCAYIEMESGDELVFGGSSMLMTIYANGVGASRNYDLAIKLACKIEGAPAEVEGRVEHLEKLKAKNWQGRDFSLCDDITSGFMQGHCAAHEQRFADIKRENKLAALMAAWSPEDRNAYSVLREAARRFIEARVDNEVDLSGTARSAFIIEEEAALERDFAQSLNELEQGKAPTYSSEDFRLADGKLNSVYRRVQNAKPSLWGTVTKEGIKNTQRVWIKYRDAWVVFADRKYPAVGADSIMTRLSKKRTRMLEEFLQ